MSAFGGQAGLDGLTETGPGEVQYWVPNICSSLQSRLNRLLPKSTNEIEKEHQNYDGGRTDETSIAGCKSCSCARVHRACFGECSTSTTQEFSNKPIRIIVGLVAGGATDVTARLIAQKLSESLHTNVYVENRPGAAFEPALRELTGAPPDGHTLFMISASVV